MIYHWRDKIVILRLAWATYGACLSSLYHKKMHFS